ncbi:macrolide ABC transporter ATP-binding protein [Candidatus Shapirobacteria bacterium CG03_land_8_20_14_0_80_40_19]|uniref:Macrolide ABC transporter ATP-binding protein n=3 Tax=Candidatus Shapironibacteriota TaxID=1752721 RepID=A0A2M7BF45_9BACT|nr:MAG: macrolide ABC transporter ATP-binding protein [Candidatus Shapirobacteria bacterium CG03_land_8_20_14_0_80_40_19]PJC29002.1 MAG: macrolide ABC transporter ATP-binding protein [Candidatus Shapirobacteria bacterium CG_4_9_14_0_2_um_filter_40_11]PJC77337.1 MAG: macrolide ABC transporter ATP-binding protein [Candidatus Shapirobacteria bacterium CG_4_8_14_3_um_filter_39_11]
MKTKLSFIAIKKVFLLQLKNITKTYLSGTSEFDALKDVSLKISEGEFISITGPSGSGKSTLMHIIGLLDNPTSGEVILQGKDIARLNESELAVFRNKILGFVFQQFNLLSKTSSLENVMLPLLYSDIPSEKRKNLALEMLAKVNLSGKLKNLPSQLSGGEQQRVAIARALINNPKIILADEPTGNLDSKTGREVMDLLHKSNKEEKRTIILVTHDPDLANEAERILVIKDGKITERQNA